MHRSSQRSNTHNIITMYVYILPLIIARPEQAGPGNVILVFILCFLKFVQCQCSFRNGIVVFYPWLMARLGPLPHGSHGCPLYIDFLDCPICLNYRLHQHLPINTNMCSCKLHNGNTSKALGPLFAIQKCTYHFIDEM